MSSNKKKTSKGSNDVDLASLVSNIKKNVGTTQTASSASVSTSKSSSSSSSSKSKSSKSSDKPSTVELDKELRKKEKKAKSAKKPTQDDDELPAPKERKRSREQVQEAPTRGEDEWDDDFEKDDIEDIFGKLKTNKEARMAAEKQSEEEKASLQMLLDRAAKRSANNSVAIRQSNVKKDPNRRYTEDGFPIYTTEELGLSTKGGDTPLCPFDCECCF